MRTASLLARSVGTAGLLCLLATVGCSTSATLVTQRPAETPAFGRGRVAVMKFTGSADSQGVVRQVVVDQLARSGLVPMLHGDQLQQYASVPLYRSNGHLKRDVALEAARRAGADSLLLGQLHHIEPDGTIWGQKSFRFGDPSILAVIQYELVDVQSGSVVLDGRVESSVFKGEFANRGHNSESEVLGRLTREAAEELAKRLVPYDDEVLVTLASAGYGKGAGRIREGNRAASDGDWQTAARQWEAALRENPDNHAALYNLSLAQEAFRDYAAAERNLQNALALSDRQTYRDALQRIRQSSQHHHEAIAQRTSVGVGPARLANRQQPVATWPPNAGIASGQAGHLPPRQTVQAAYRLPPVSTPVPSLPRTPNYLSPPPEGHPRHGQPPLNDPPAYHPPGYPISGHPTPDYPTPGYPAAGDFDPQGNNSPAGLQPPGFQPSRPWQPELQPRVY